MIGLLVWLVQDTHEEVCAKGTLAKANKWLAETIHAIHVGAANRKGQGFTLLMEDAASLFESIARHWYPLRHNENLGGENLEEKKEGNKEKKDKKEKGIKGKVKETNKGAVPSTAPEDCPFVLREFQQWCKRVHLAPQLAHKDLIEANFDELEGDADGEVMLETWMTHLDAMHTAKYEEHRKTREEIDRCQAGIEASDKWLGDLLDKIRAKLERDRERMSQASNRDVAYDIGDEVNKEIGLEGDKWAWFEAVGGPVTDDPDNALGVIVRGGPGLDSEETGQISLGKLCRIESMQELESGLLRGHVVEPMEGWVCVKYLQCQSHACGFCAGCETGMLPSEVAFEKVLDDAQYVFTKMAGQDMLVDKEEFLEAQDGDISLFTKLDADGSGSIHLEEWMGFLEKEHAARAQHDTKRGDDWLKNFIASVAKNVKVSRYPSISSSCS